MNKISSSRLLRFLILLLAFILLRFPEAVDAKLKLKKKVPALCYECHQDLKERLKDPYVHFLFKEGKCIKCHYSHVSDEKALLANEINTLCLNCHAALRILLGKSIVHKAVKNGKCTDCHSPHSSNNRHLLLKDEKTLCWNCHEELKEATKRPYTCESFALGRCSECHDSHASTQESLLQISPQKLCTRCHAAKCKAGKVSISSVTGDLDCTSCHTGHGSKRKGALGPFGHEAFLKRKCQECHRPITSSKNITVRKNGSALCLDCHTGDDATYIYAPGDIHIKGAPNPCIVCHSQHAANNENLTKNESTLCMKCHEDVLKKTRIMQKNLKSTNCTPVKNNQCFDCHVPMHSDLQFNFRDYPVNLCGRCHVSEHSTTHPVGNDIIDPRNGEPVTCISCHSMHNAKADFMLTFDRNRALCIQCHKM